ncbi:hypothetical protein CPB85DRAFT_1312085, partial [Mucidula mucida]
GFLYSLPCTTGGVWMVVVLLLPSSMLFHAAVINSGDSCRTGLYGEFVCGVEFLVRSLGSSFVGIVSYRRLRVESAEASTHTGHGDESPLALLVSDDLPSYSNMDADCPARLATMKMSSSKDISVADMV